MPGMRKKTNKSRSMAQKFADPGILYQTKLLAFAKKFIKYVSKECDKHGITFELVHAKFLPSDSSDAPGERYFGYFDEGHGYKELKVASDRPLEHLIYLIAHEFSHLRQWKDVGFEDQFLADGTYSGDVISSFLSGRRTSRDKLEWAVSAHIAIELDCEKRAIALLTRLGCPADLKKYIKIANGVLIHYQENIRRRSYTKTGRIIADEPSIYQEMPDDFDTINYFDRSVCKAYPKIRALYSKRFAAQLG